MDEFIALVGEVWADSTFGVSPAELLTALGVFLTFAVLRGLFTRFVLGLSLIHISEPTRPY